MASKKAPVKKPATKKVAMVQPKPAPPEEYTLEEVLRLAGNTRSFTFIRQHGNAFRVHFSGDYVPSTVKMINGKPVIIKDE